MILSIMSETRLFDRRHVELLSRAKVEDGWIVVKKAVSAVRKSPGSFSRIPAIAMATAVAAVLLLILVAPRGGKLPVMGLSREDWDESGFPSPIPEGLRFMSQKVEGESPELLELNIHVQSKWLALASKGAKPLPLNPPYSQTTFLIMKPTHGNLIS